MTEEAGTAKTKNNTRTGCGCLIFIVVVITIVIAVAGGSGGKSASPEKEAREYISQKGHEINIGRVDYEHVLALTGLATKAGDETGAVVDELAKVAQEAHNELNEIRSELYKLGGNEKLSDATLELSEGANELKNTMGAIVAYTGDPNPATLAHVTTQLETAKGKWNAGAEEIWHIANKSGAMTLQ